MSTKYKLARNEDVVNKKFNKLTVLEELPKLVKYQRRVLAQCECGTVKAYRLSHLTSGATVSCGCAYGLSFVKDQATFDAEIKDKPFHALTPYVRSTLNMKFECDVCGNVWKTRPTNITATGHGCPVCGLKKCGEAHKKHNEILVDRGTWLEVEVGADKPMLIDKADYEYLKKEKGVGSFHVRDTGYVIVRCDGYQRSVHHFMFPNSKLTDHISGDPLDNRRSNLRPVTIAQNSHNSKLREDNSSSVKGVRRSRNGKKWNARIVYEGTELYLGTFATFENAVYARKRAEYQYFGEYNRETSWGGVPKIDLTT